MDFQQGRSERRGEEVQTTLCAIRSPFSWVLANGKIPSSASENVEPLSDATCLREALRRRQGTKLEAIFNIPS
ncbi:MAG: hypothetical protein HOP00_03130 [Nitrospira sp.]|nr:hypothetical protein [Nitrospira sp.]